MLDTQVKRKYDLIAHYYDERWKGYLDATHKVAIDLLNPKNTDIILDVSGGTGLLCEKIVTKLGNKGKIFLIDISKEMLEKAKNRLSQHKNIIIRQEDVHNLNFTENYFSKIVNISSFHYYTNPQKVLSVFHKILKKNGELILVDWCRDSIHFKVHDLFMKLFSKEYVKTYSSKELIFLLEEANLQIGKVVSFTHFLWRLIGIKAIKC